MLQCMDVCIYIYINIYIYMYIYIWRFPKLGVPPVIIHFNRIVLWKPSILGYPHFRKPPYIYIYIRMYIYIYTWDDAGTVNGIMPAICIQNAAIQSYHKNNQSWHADMAQHVWFEITLCVKQTWVHEKQTKQTNIYKFFLFFFEACVAVGLVLL